MLEQVLYLVRCPEYVSAGWDSRLATAKSVSDGEEFPLARQACATFHSRGGERGERMEQPMRLRCLLGAVETGILYVVWGLDRNLFDTGRP
jgi:hypothetical protein